MAASSPARMRQTKEDTDYLEQIGLKKVLQQIHAAVLEARPEKAELWKMIADFAGKQEPEEEVDEFNPEELEEEHGPLADNETKAVSDGKVPKQLVKQFESKFGEDVIRYRALGDLDLAVMFLSKGDGELFATFVVDYCGEAKVTRRVQVPSEEDPQAFDLTWETFKNHEKVPNHPTKEKRKLSQKEQLLKKFGELEESMHHFDGGKAEPPTELTNELKSKFGSVKTMSAFRRFADPKACLYLVMDEKGTFWGIVGFMAPGPTFGKMKRIPEINIPDLKEWMHREGHKDFKLDLDHCME